MLNDFVNIGILCEVKLSILPIAGDTNIQKLTKLSLVTEFIFHKETGLQVFEFLNITSAKSRNNIIHVEEDDDSAIYKTARFLENRIKA